MIELSSCMIPWNSIFSVFSGNTLVAIGILLVLIIVVKGRLAAKNTPCIGETFWRQLIIAGICSMVAVLVFQSVANFAFFAAVQAAPGLKGENVLGALCGLCRSSNGWKVVVLLLLVLLVGAGYAFSAIEAPLLIHIPACIVGIGLLEEGCKCLAALILFSTLYAPKGLKRSTSPFVIAGLGFGGGEALHYFGAYNLFEYGFATYLGRVLWCIPLHVAWALIAGDMIVRGFSRTIFTRMVCISDLKKDDNYLTLLVCLAPAAALHGIYDALCFHNNPLSFVVGSVSLVWGFIIFRRSKDELVATVPAC